MIYYYTFIVTPAKAGVQTRTGFPLQFTPLEFTPWIPAYAGMTHGAGMTLRAERSVRGKRGGNEQAKKVT